MLLKHADELEAVSPTIPRIVIVGSGAVGLYAAAELAKRGRDVLVIEAGGTGLSDFEPGSYSSVGLPHDGIRLGRSRGLGGTTNLWGGQLVEYQPVDFNGRDWLPDSKWPIAYDEVAPYYDITYDNLGISSDARDDQQVLANVFQKPPQFEHGLELFLTRWLKVPSFSVAYREQIRLSKRLAVLLNHTVVGFSGERNRISEVRAVDLEGETHSIVGDLFILAAGTIETCRLLLHAAVTPGWDCPWGDNANIGAYFQDHLCGTVASVDPIDRSRFVNTFSNLIWSHNKFQPKLRMTNEALEKVRILNVHGALCFESSVSEHFVYLKQFLKAAIQSRKVAGLGDLKENLRACFKYLLPLMWKYAVANRILVPGTSKISFGIQSEQAPRKESRITIDSASLDRFGLPRVILNWKAGDQELKSIREFTIRCNEALQEAGLARLLIDQNLIEGNGKFAATLRDNYHQAGGARMGDSKSDGVVDRNLCVFGTSNLYVAGAATFRTTGNANTTFTALAFTTRLVDHLCSNSQHSGHAR